MLAELTQEKMLPDPKSYCPVPSRKAENQATVRFLCKPRHQIYSQPDLLMRKGRKRCKFSENIELRHHPGMPVWFFLTTLHVNSSTNRENENFQMGKVMVL